ncbi:dol-P-Glc:Glc(2)Man(9)GlcNAc(2)-PP-Dol alpha-1,2-glucosyltransferase [Battus philenor]|uniref:dol-P-Glc:Glc(2)Man(9)GlcNAc(2)-PP-Dol alpha-1,2-glucosyltransferase n=1 Tax=Battus philenor TaxID=42288 RepID=UPI0035D07384
MARIKYHIILEVVLIGYFALSKIIFDKVFATTAVVVDEMYHLPQGALICNGNYSYWDPKITTLPGLYLFSAAMLSPFFSCSTYNLRFVNLIASGINFILFSSMLQFIYGNQTESHFRIILQTISLSILPPLYFFSHVYYTDTLSLTFLLAYTRVCFSNGSRLLMILFGSCAILMRQTNIAWIGMVFLYKGMDVFVRSSRVFGNTCLNKSRLSTRSYISKETDSSKLKRYYDLYDAYAAFVYHGSTCLTTFANFLTGEDITFLSAQLVLIGSFMAFVIFNGGIVIGDKKAHEATLHLPQLLYFLLFYGIFGLPYVLAKMKTTLILILKKKRNALALAVAFAVIVHYNTVVHPYLLADNRHYTFYIWNRWFGKYPQAGLATVPVYVFLLFSLYDNLKDQNCITFLIPYSVSTFLVLALQKMIEVRYFLIPYIILRLRFVRPSNKVILGEFLWYLILNFLTFRLFFTKEIYWDDFPYAQRIMW